MKKSNVAVMGALALAIGIAPGASRAQSSVTLYGILDAGITYVSNTGGSHVFKFDDGVSYGNRIGFKGTEDLGGGLKAVFVLESGFRLGNGQLGFGGAQFGRQAYVGLQNNWGTLSFGNQLDMTNYKGDPKDIYLISDYTNATQNTYLANLAKAYLPELAVGTSQCGYACSDHASWNAQGYPASFPFEADQNDNPYIHSAYDTLERSDSQGNHALKYSKLALASAALRGGGLSASAKR